MAGAESVALALARAVATKDGYSNGHVEEVANYAVLLGEELGMDPAELKIRKPEISLEWLKMSIRFAHYAGAPVVNTDEGPKPPWTSKEMDYTLMTYTLTEAAMVAERHGVKIGLEPHQQYSKTLEGLDSIYELVDSPAIGINSTMEAISKLTPSLAN